MIINANIKWEKQTTENFIDNKYSRVHQWKFDGGMKFKASASPEIVPEPMSDPSFIDPEEAFIACVSSCHMLFFLSIAAKKKIVIKKYEDNATAVFEKDETGKVAILSINLNPKIEWGENSKLDIKEIEAIHHLAHSSCFIANSIKSKIIY
jgi:organic hydroperoxide reductase OsmC/OhrA